MLRKIVYALVGALVFGTIAWSLVVAQSTDVDSANLIAIIAIIIGAVVGYWAGGKITGNESPKTLAAFFIFVGVVHIINLFINQNGEASLSPTFTLENIVSVVIGFAMILIGFNIRKILTKYPSWILTLSYVSLGILILFAVYAFATNSEKLLGVLLWYAVDAYLLFHLINSIKRLSKNSP